RIATASNDQSVKIWDAESGRELLTLRGHSHVVLCVTFSPDDHLLASGSIDTTARVWDATPFPADELREQEVRRLIPPIHEWHFKDELKQQLRDDLTLSDQVRAAALAIVDKLEDEPEELDSESWGSCKYPALSLDERLLALRRAEAAVRLAPGN